MMNSGPRDIHLSLTARELEVYELLLTAHSNKQISSHLDVSIHTVRYHVRQILRKFACCNRVELLALLLGTHSAGSR